MKENIDMNYDKSCIICEYPFSDADFQAGDVVVVTTEPSIAMGRFVNGELRLFHKETAFHESCRCKRKYQEEFKNEGKHR